MEIPRGEALEGASTNGVSKLDELHSSSLRKTEWFCSRVHQENAEDAARRLRIGKERQEQGSNGAEIKESAMKMRENRKTTDHSRSTFDTFLDEKGIREEVEAVAIKPVLAWQLEQAMGSSERRNRQWRGSRSQLDRMLDPRNVSVTLDTIARAARALGKRVIIGVADAKARRAWLAQSEIRAFRTIRRAYGQLADN
jgi:hypothetical protein